MTEIEISREVAAPAAVTWEVATDIDGLPEVVEAIESVERISGPEFGVGTRWRETRRMLGRAASEEMEIIAVDPGRSYEVAARSGGADYRSVLAVSAIDGHRCRGSMSFEARPTSAVPKLLSATLGRLFVGATRKMVEGDLTDVARTAERRAAAG